MAKSNRTNVRRDGNRDKARSIAQLTASFESFLTGLESDRGFLADAPRDERTNR